MWASQVVLEVKKLPVKARDVRDVGLIPESGRSPGGGNGNPLQYSCLGNSMDRGAWWATVHWVTKSRMPPQLVLSYLIQDIAIPFHKTHHQPPVWLLCLCAC